MLPRPPNQKQNIEASYTQLAAGSRLLRLSMPDWSDSLFCPIGPLHRFDHHPVGARQAHAGYGVCYLGTSLASCIAETCLSSYPTNFAVNGVLNPARLLVEVEATRPMELLDLSLDGPLKAGTFLGILDEYQSRSITQEWARRFYLNPYDEYRYFDGIQWPSAKNGDLVFVFYERARDGLKIVSTSAISKKPLKTQVQRICLNYRIVFDA